MPRTPPSPRRTPRAQRTADCPSPKGAGQGLPFRQGGARSVLGIFFLALLSTAPGAASGIRTPRAQNDAETPQELWTAPPAPPLAPLHQLEPRLLRLSPESPQAKLTLAAPESAVLALWCVPRTRGLDLHLRVHDGSSESGDLLATAAGRNGFPDPWCGVLVREGQALTVTVEAVTPIDMEEVVELFARTAIETDDSREAARRAGNLRAAAEQSLRRGEVEAAEEQLLGLVSELIVADPRARSVAVDQALMDVYELLSSRSAEPLDDPAVLQLLEHRRRVAQNLMPPHAESSMVSHRVLGLCLRAAERYERAAVILERCLSHLERLLEPGHPRTIELRAELARALGSLGQLDRVDELMQRSLREVESQAPFDEVAYQQARIRLGQVLFDSGHPGEALVELEQALEEFAEAELPESNPRVQLAIGLAGECQFQLQNFHAARRLQEHFLAIADPRVFSTGAIWRARWNLACTMLRLGDVHLARRVFREAELLDMTTSPVQRMGLLLNLAQTWAVSPLPGSSEAQLERLEGLLEFGVEQLGMGHELTLRAAALFATTLHLIADRQGPHPRLEAILAPVEESARQILTAPDTAQASWLGEIERALLHASALEALNRGENARAETLSQLAYDTAPRSAGRADTMATNALASLLLAQAAQGLVEAPRDAFLELCDRVDSNAHLRQLLSAPREARAEAVRHTLSFEALLAVARCAEQPLGADLEARLFASAESTRAVEFLALRMRRTNGLSEARTELRARAQSASRRLASALAGRHLRDRDLARLVRDRDLALGRLQAQLDGRVAPPQPDAAALGRALDSDEVGISYRVHESLVPAGAQSAAVRGRWVSAWVVRSGGDLARVELGPVEEIEDALDAWREGLGVGMRDPQPRADIRAAGEHLRELVLDPLLPHLAGARRAWVAPDGVLHELPFEALPDEAHKPLGERLRVRIVPALAVLLLPPGSEDVERPLELLAVGGVDYGDAPSNGVSPQFEPLLHTRREVESIWSLWSADPGRGGQLMLGPSASRQRFEASASQATHLHVATHSRAQGLDAARSVEGEGPQAATLSDLAPLLATGLAFAGANATTEAGATSQEGFLTAEEIAQLDLERCALAVLSACRTSQGLARSGQETASLQTAVHAAGARNAITSLWPVDDAATAEMMTRLYRHLLAGASADEALWTAKMEMRTTQADARHWAGWVLSSGSR